jgi:phosphotriesterase-related protein
MTTTATSRAGFAQTVLGPVAPASLGLTLPHEHLLIDLRFLFRPPVPGSALGHELAPIELGNLYEVNYDWFSSLDNLHLTDEPTAVEEARLFRLAGGRTLVDPTTVGIGRDPLALQRIARATGLHVIMGSGYYTEPAHPPGLAAADEDALAQEIIRDVTEGVGNTGVRAGLIGEIGCSWPWAPAERKALRAAAAAARETGAGPSSTPAATWSTTCSASRSRTSPGAGRKCRTTPSACGRSSGWWSRATVGRSCCRTTCASRSGWRATAARGSPTSLAGSCPAFGSAASPSLTSGRWSSRTPPER